MGAFSDAEKNKMLDAYTGRATYTANTAVWVKLHLGSPGTAGTTNPAAETTRKQATFGSAPSAGTISNTVAIEWTSYPANETVTHASFWDASTGGNFLGSDDLPTAKVMSIGDTLRIPVGDFDLAITGTLP